MYLFDLIQIIKDIYSLHANNGMLINKINGLFIIRNLSCLFKMKFYLSLLSQGKEASISSKKRQSDLVTTVCQESCQL